MNFNESNENAEAYCKLIDLSLNKYHESPAIITSHQQLSRTTSNYHESPAIGNLAEIEFL